MKAVIFFIIVFSFNLFSQTLVGHWMFLGNTADSSGMGNHGTINGSVTLTSDRCGNPNSAYMFNGGYISVGNNGFPTGNSQRTLCAWFKRDITSSGEQNIFGYGDNSFDGCRNYLFMRTQNSLLGNENRNAINVFNWLPDTNWHFLAAVFPQGGTQTGHFLIYYDGNLVADSSYLSATAFNTNTGFPTIGCLMGGNLNLYIFKGKIDDVRLYSTALNASQIAQLYGAPPVPTLLSPPNNSSGISLTPLLDWSPSPTATYYGVQLSVNPAFATTLIDTIVNSDSLRVPAGRLSNNVMYYWRVRASICASNSLYSSTFSFATAFLGIKQTGSEIPVSFKLYNNYPNPFNPNTKIKFSIPKSSFTTLVIYDVTGREVTTLVNEQLQPGTYEVDWDGSSFSSGIYYYELVVRQAGSSTGDYSETRKMVLIK